MRLSNDQQNDGFGEGSCLRLSSLTKDTWVHVRAAQDSLGEGLSTKHKAVVESIQLSKEREKQRSVLRKGN